MKIESLTSEANGSLKQGDVLIAVAGVNVRKMPLSRVAQKLNQFRVPINSSVKLTFERKVSLVALESDAMENEIKQDEKVLEFSFYYFFPHFSHALE
jgi:C-terminal processing protease CtpA/Prc